MTTTRITKQIHTTQKITYDPHPERPQPPPRTHEYQKPEPEVVKRKSSVVEKREICIDDCCICDCLPMTCTDLQHKLAHPGAQRLPPNTDSTEWWDTEEEIDKSLSEAGLQARREDFELTQTAKGAGTSAAEYNAVFLPWGTYPANTPNLRALCPIR
jgi:hypothetical protein